jgi:putative SOS response-associated peptidase YedK
MCGRYRLGRGKQAFAKVFGVWRDDVEWEPRFNIAPTQLVPTVRQDTREPERYVSVMRWGLIPYWATDPSVGSKMINARSETAASKPAFNEALQKRRCLIPADGFYEWQRSAKTKQPFCFTLNDNAVFAFAGIWDRWRDAESKTVETFSILTTSANSVTSDVHDRMPVILQPDDYDLWLDPGFRRVDELVHLLKPLDGALMNKYPVSIRVNSVSNDDAQCAKPIALAPAAMSLFPEL